MGFDLTKLNAYPQEPGVYLMRGKQDAILYIGKAKNLKMRIKQYFVSGSGDGRWIVPFLQEKVIDIDTVVTHSEKEALLLESTLIKKHQPKYNALLKDDKAYTAIKINIKHSWPMLSLIRYKGKLKNDALYFGPYTSAFAARQTLELMQKLFPLRQCSDQELLRRTRPCILYGMKRCTAPCVGLIGFDAYKALVESAADFLRGKSASVLENLNALMEKASANLEFEEAARYYHLIESIEKTLQKQSVAKPMYGITADVLGIYRQGDEVVLSQLNFLEGKLEGYRHHHFSKIMDSDAELLESFILQNYQDLSHCPKEIILPIHLENAGVIEEILEGKTELFTPQRGEKRSLVEMAEKNAEASFKQKKDEKTIRERVLLELQEKLSLSHYPGRIECIDTSHFSGTNSVSALVAFRDGMPDKSLYRKYRLKEVRASDDYGALKEVLMRRYKNGLTETNLPDLLIIDGGKGHLNIGRKILNELNIASVDIISFAKEEGRHDRGVTQERVFLPDVKDPIFLPPHSPLLFLLQKIRDEAHRFAISFQKKRRVKSTVKSELSSVPGIGPVKQKALLQTFGSVKNIKQAKDEELLALKKITKKDVQKIREGLS